ncbi:MAG: hypothetical protein AAB766_02815 [Patescibacteria group bacterium]
MTTDIREQSPYQERPLDESTIETEFRSLIQRLRTQANNFRFDGPFDHPDKTRMWHFYAESPGGSTLFAEIRYDKKNNVFRGFVDGIPEFDEYGFKVANIQDILIALHNKFSNIT